MGREPYSVKRLKEIYAGHQIKHRVLYADKNTVTFLVHQHRALNVLNIYKDGKYDILHTFTCEDEYMWERFVLYAKSFFKMGFAKGEQYSS